MQLVDIIYIEHVTKLNIQRQDWDKRELLKLYI